MFELFNNQTLWVIEVSSKFHYSNIPFNKTIQTVVPLLKHNIPYVFNFIFIKDVSGDSF